MKTIEIDEHTAEVLEAQAAARGVTIGQVVADLVAFIDPPSSGGCRGTDRAGPAMGRDRGR
ncbi:MAG: hypothetical protein ACJ8E5_18430 [Xanthobacteraceae bacterium]